MGRTFQGFDWGRTFVLCTLAMLTPTAYSQPACDPLLRPVTGQLGYVPRETRCEGLYVSPISGRTLEIVSLTLGTVRYSLDSDMQLELRGPDSALLDQEKLNVRAVALPLNTYYRMDDVLPAGETLTWPIDAVLLPARLNDGRIGIFGWVDTLNERIFAPIEILGRERAQDPRRTVNLIVRSTVETNGVLWRS